jgi:hypothetical protein
MGKKVIDAKNDAKGNISHVKLSGNQGWTPLDAAIRMADRGQIDKVHVVRPADAKTHIRTNPDSRVGNNLDTLAED